MAKVDWFVRIPISRSYNHHKKSIILPSQGSTPTSMIIICVPTRLCMWEHELWQLKFVKKEKNLMGERIPGEKERYEQRKERDGNGKK